MSKVAVWVKLAIQPGKRDEADGHHPGGARRGRRPRPARCSTSSTRDPKDDERRSTSTRLYTDQRRARRPRRRRTWFKAFGPKLGPVLAGRPAMTVPHARSAARASDPSPVVATYLDRILARHREVAAHGPAVDRRSDRRGRWRCRRRAASAPRSAGRRRLGGDQRGQAPLAVEGRPQRRARPGRAGRRLRSAAARRACRCSPTRSSSAARPPTCRRRGPRARCRCCARTSPSAPHDVLDARLMGADCVLLIAAALDAQRADRVPRAGRRGRPRRARRDPRRGRARGGARRRGHADRREPARPGDVRGRPRARRAHGRRRCPPTW